MSPAPAEIWDRWAETVRRREPDVPLGEAALLISASANPDLDVEAQLSRLDELALGVGRPGAGPGQEPDADAVCDLLFGRFGLRGDDRSYDHPDNSYLDRVLERRRGIPITLSVLLIEVAGRCGVPLEGVGMPGHFLVRDPSRPTSLIDPFGGGRRLGMADCERVMQLATGSPMPLAAEMLQRTGTHAILGRMLLNLDRSFGRRGDCLSLRWVSELRLRLPGMPAGDRVQLASRLSVLGRFDAAAEVLEGTARTLTPGPARDRLSHEAVTFRARLN